MKKMLILLLVVFITLIFGCTQTTTTNDDSASATEPEENFLAGLFATPDSYCVTYSTIAAAYTASGESMASEMTYCKDKSNVAIEIEALGNKMHSFCLDGKGSSCYGEGSSAMCAEDTNICGSLSEPFAQANMDQYQPSMYVKSSAKQIAGLTALCYSMDVVAAGKAAGQDTSQIPEQMRYMSFCYHPQYKYLLYYSYAGTTVEVKSFVTPASAEKFVLPVKVQTLE